MANVANDLLRGAIDMHVHTAPDVVPRLMNDLELAEAVLEAGMGGMVIKSHHMLTADRAQILQRLFPEITVFGGLALNVPASGGLNPEAVKVAIQLGAKIIWLPTLSATNHMVATRDRAPGAIGVMSQGFAPRAVQVLDETGVVRSELREILELIARADIVLGTGHLSPRETRVVVDAAQEVGVRKILVNHPELFLVGMGIEDQRELAAKGVMIERCIQSITIEGNGNSARSIADQIKAVGAESTVMATDFGQTYSPPPPDGMAFYIEQMLEYGISPEEIETMVRVNPRRLLGIEG